MIYWIVREDKSYLCFTERLTIAPSCSSGSSVHSNGGGRISEPPLTLCRPKTSGIQRPPDIPPQVPSIQVHPSVLALPPSQAMPHAFWLRRLVSTAVLWRSYRRWLFFLRESRNIWREHRRNGAPSHFSIQSWKPSFL